jgi:nuclear RNA export factor
MARRFATLTTLDQQPIDPDIAFKAAEQSAKLTPGLSPSIKSATAKKKQRDPIVFPVPVTGGFFESEPTRDFVGGFLTKSVQSILRSFI